MEFYKRVAVVLGVTFQNQIFEAELFDNNLCLWV